MIGSLVAFTPSLIVEIRSITGPGWYSWYYQPNHLSMCRDLFRWADISSLSRATSCRLLITWIMYFLWKMHFLAMQRRVLKRASAPEKQIWKDPERSSLSSWHEVVLLAFNFCLFVFFFPSSLRWSMWLHEHVTEQSRPFNCGVEMVQCSVLDCKTTRRLYASGFLGYGCCGPLRWI